MRLLSVKYNLFMCLLALSFYLSPSSINAQETRLYFESYTTENGLSQNLVRKTVQSSSGFIWLITAHGLSRFDGDKFKDFNYNKNDSNGIPTDFLTDIIADKEKGIWIASFGMGLIYYSPQNNVFKSFIDSNKINADIHQIVKIYIDKTKHIWIGTNNSVYRSKYTKSELLTLKHDLDTAFVVFQNPAGSLKILSFYQDSVDNLWIGTKSGLFIADTLNNQLKSAFLGTQKLVINSILEFEKGVLLLATSQGAYLYDTKQQKLKNFFQSYSGLSINTNVKVDALEKDKDGNFWLGTFGKGLIYFNKQKQRFYQYLKNYDDEYSIRSNLVASIFIDASNTLFVGLRGAGLNIAKIRKNTFQLYRHKKNQISISNNIIWGIMALSDSQIWIGTQKGLNLFNPLKQSFINKFGASYDKSAFVRIFPESKNHFITGTTDFLARFYLKEYRFQLLDWEQTKNVQNNYITGFYKKNDTTTLISFYGKGVLEYQSDGRIRKQIENTESLYIKYMLPLGDSILWLATTGEGLLKYNLKTNNIFRYTLKTGLNSNNLNFLYLDQNNILWIAGSAGINKLDIKQNKIINLNNPYPEIHAEIYSIEEDGKNNLWMGSNIGLLKYNKINNQYYIFKSEQGLQNSEFNTASSAKTPDGHMIFGGINGFNYFHPDSINVSEFVPEIVITGFSLFYKEYNINDKYQNHIILDKSIAYTDTLFLKYNENVIGISFSALDYSNPKNIDYAYRLKGFNNQWVYTDAYHKYASYTNLAPGNYIFQIKSTNADRVWTNNTKNLFIIIEPAFWQQFWFKIALIVLLFVSIYFYIRLRTRWALRQQKKLAALVREQTFEITEKNTELEEQTEELNQLAKQLGFANKTLEKKVKKRTKKLHKALKEAKQAENLISSFLANISHEIRTPINAISGFSQLMVSTDLNEEQKQAYGQIIDQNIDMLLDEFDSIMNIAKLHSGKYRINNSSFSLNMLFDDLYNEFSKILRTENKPLELVQETNVRLQLFSDKIVMKQIMHQLIDNALKYTEKGSVKFGFRIQAQQEEDCDDILKTVYDKNIKTKCFLILFVKDTGIGINPKQQKIIFDAFMKVESREKLFRGTGLGLSIVKKFADILNAEIKLYSKINEGTRIELKIPLMKI